MKQLLKLIAMAAALQTLVPAYLSAVEIVPAPSFMRENRSIVRIPSEIGIHVSDKSLKPAARTFMDSAGKKNDDGLFPEFKFVPKAGTAFMVLDLDTSLSGEEYVLEIGQAGISIKGGGISGVWWGLHSVMQILVQSASNADENGMFVSGMVVKDKPAFSYRGAMLDCCRHFFSVDDVKTYIDIMALHKLNVFHWHLTDDQGWRIEIKKYPELTRKGSVRKETVVGHAASSDTYDGIPYGGYYTQKDIREVVRYAAERQITVIPEIEMPGHAMAALAAYPQFGCVGHGYDVWTTWGVSKEVFCIGKQGTIEFLKDVLDEVAGLFPGEYIHIGGDEAPSERWDECPDCRKLVETEGYSTSRELQGYLLREIEAFLKTKGKKIIGWDEILDGGVTNTATVMSWRGPAGGIRAAKQGNHVIMSPNSNFYLDYYQTENPEKNGEPHGIGGYVSLEKCLSFDPYDGLSDDEKKYIVGIQANLWTEYIPSMNHVQHMVLPRLAALAEVSWSENKCSYQDFVRRMEVAMVPLYSHFGYAYADYAFRGIR